MTSAIGPGTPLICVKWSQPADYVPGGCLDDRTLTVDALYFCTFVAEMDEACPWDNCGEKAVILDGKACACADFAYCPNLFRPLNDGDTSLVKDELSVVELAGSLWDATWTKELESIDE